MIPKVLKIENKEDPNTEQKDQSKELCQEEEKQIKREIIPDTKFNDKVLSKFINIVMYDGKKSKSEKIVYDALDIASKKLKISKPIDLFKTALNNVKPGIEVRSRRVGGATYQVPVEVRNEEPKH